MHESKLLLQVTQLIFQLALIIIASWGSLQITNKLKIPSVIGYILIGIILGPFVLGSIPLSAFPEGIFPLIHADIPISPILYSYSTIAAILLLFLSGLETDMVLFVRYAITGSLVGIGGLIISFIGGYLVSVLYSDVHLLHPSHLFMGTIATATSVGITTAILSGKQKVNSPEGVTILSAAVLDDVLGIIVLAIVMGLADTLQHETTLNSKLFFDITLIALKAIGIWLGCTILGIIFSRRLGKRIKRIFRDATTITIISLGIAFFLGGLFEIMGLSMVIGAYIVGLTLSNTDLSYVIQEKIHPLAVLFIPIFFVITGMTINLQEIFEWNTVVFGLAYSLVCIISKIIGGGIPALFLGFTPIGALRVGVGLAPRGEIALIIASLGVSIGIVDNTLLGAVLIMIISSSIISPLILDKLLSSTRRGVHKEQEEVQTKTEFDFENRNLTRLILSDFLQLIEEENFFINHIERKEKTIYHIRKDDIFITLTHINNKFIFLTEKNSISFIKTALYEATANIAESAQTIKNSLDPKNVIASETTSHSGIVIADYIDPSLTTLHIKANTKLEIITELSELLYQVDLLIDKQQFIGEVLERENTFSTGLQEGIAIPHAKSDAIKKTSIVIGIKPEGVDFDSLDGKPSTIFLLIASRKDTPHLSILTHVSTLLNSQAFRTKLLACNRKADMITLFNTHSHHQ